MTLERQLYEVDKNKYPTDRYRKHRRYTDDNGMEVPETYVPGTYPTHHLNLFYEVQPGEEDALDLIASKEEIYNDETLWWIIAEANEIEDPLNVPVGTSLRIPQINSLYLRGGPLA